MVVWTWFGLDADLYREIFDGFDTEVKPNTILDIFLQVTTRPRYFVVLMPYDHRLMHGIFIDRSMHY